MKGRMKEGKERKEEGKEGKRKVEVKVVSCFLMAYVRYVAHPLHDKTIPLNQPIILEVHIHFTSSLNCAKKLV